MSRMGAFDGLGTGVGDGKRRRRTSINNWEWDKDVKHPLGTISNLISSKNHVSGIQRCLVPYNGNRRGTALTGRNRMW